MTQPNILTVPFAENAAPQTIQEIPISRDPSDPIQKASWSTGFPAATMQPMATGGEPPMGQDFNGIFKALSEHIVYQNKGGVYRWSADVVASGGYDKGAVVQAGDGIRSYVSLIDGNTQALGGSNWLLISMPIATQAQAQGLTSGDTLITPQRLGDSMSRHVLGMGQTWQDVTSSRETGVTYTNTTGRTIAVSARSNPVALGGGNIIMWVASNQVMKFDSGSLSQMNRYPEFSVFGIVPPGASYSISSTYVISTWMELR